MDSQTTTAISFTVLGMCVTAGLTVWRISRFKKAADPDTLKQRLVKPNTTDLLMLLVLTLVVERLLLPLTRPLGV